MSVMALLCSQFLKAAELQPVRWLQLALLCSFVNIVHSRTCTNNIERTANNAHRVHRDNLRDRFQEIRVAKVPSSVNSFHIKLCVIPPIYIETT